MEKMYNINLQIVKEKKTSLHMTNNYCNMNRKFRLLHHKIDVCVLF